jgi:hypothetical protein
MTNVIRGSVQRLIEECAISLSLCSISIFERLVARCIYEKEDWRLYQKGQKNLERSAKKLSMGERKSRKVFITRGTTQPPSTSLRKGLKLINIFDN